MNKINDLFKSADSHEAEYIAFWRDFVAAESPTDFKAGVDRAVDLVLDKARSYGFKVDRGHENFSGDPAVITMNPEAAGAPLVLSGHVDTVHAVGSFGEPAVRLDGENIYGPGACDCKGGVAAALYAMAVLAECGYDKRTIKLILQTDEETSSLGSEKRTIDFMYEHAKGALAFINLEAYNPGKATVGRKGILKYTVNVTGIPMHSSLCYEGVSAVTEAAHQIIALESLKEREGITVNCGVISGGTTSNTVAGECTYTVDIRYPNERERERACRILREATEKPHLEGTHTALTKVSERCAMEPTEANYRLLADINSAFLRAGLPALEPAMRAGGSDAADMTSRGLACIDSLGVTGGYIHTTREYAIIRTLKESCRRIIAVALYL